jgi:hypothetical protein
MSTSLFGGFMASEYQVVDIWVGLFASAEVFDKYFEENDDEYDEDAPITQFATSAAEGSFVLVLLHAPGGGGLSEAGPGPHQ